MIVYSFNSLETVRVWSSDFLYSTNASQWYQLSHWRKLSCFIYWYKRTEDCGQHLPFHGPWLQPKNIRPKSGTLIRSTIWSSTTSLFSCLMASRQNVTLLFYFGCLGFVCLVFLCCLCSFLCRFPLKTILGIESHYGNDEDNLENYKKLQHDLIEARELAEKKPKLKYSSSRVYLL